ncbi:MAG: heterodisulfide reductase [Deltaproteobacteria bacterium]|nr:MAG: heterodisulfide reductase [Deltaproteobacteria bacterium]
MTYTEVESVSGEAGDFNVTLTKKPRYIKEDKCTGCTVCVEYCPVQYPDEFNQDISNNKAVHVYFAQAVPLVTYIDDSCLYLKEKKCGICESVCKAGAIDFTQAEEKVDVNVGAVILAPGIEPFDPKALAEYKYGEYANVVTSMDYERLLCATGPYQGEVLRASDLHHPKKVAWIQCVGSRSVREGANSYCSAVCCTYTQKQVILTKEHDADAACTVFHNDIRSYGKDFERYYSKTADLDDVRFFRSYVSIVREDPETGNVTIRYSTPDEGVKEEEFDMVVLSVGLAPPEDVKGLSAKFDIELNKHGFNKATPTNPMETSRKGVFVSGAFQGPTDIPESVFTASAAGSQVGELLNYRRGKLSTERRYPLEKDVSEELPKIGVFVCHCGANISRIVGVQSVAEYAMTLPGVEYAQEQLFSCATNSAQEITDITKEKGLNRVIIAACSPRTLEKLFRDTLREAGINQYYLEMANIREHCSWVHAKEKENATQKAKDIVRMAVARAHHLEPLQEFDLPVNKAALVVGGGIAGMTSSLSIADQGHEVYLLEKEDDLGGMARNLHYTIEGLDVQEYLAGLVKRVYQHPLIHVTTNATIEGVYGYVGNFETHVFNGKYKKQIKHGVAILATGAVEYKPTEYMYGEDERVMTQLELEGKIASGDETATSAATTVMIQCVGCRNEERDYCSRICCGQAVKNALKLKEKNPEGDVYVLFRDMRTYGFKEDFYRMASENEVKFIRYTPESAPEVKEMGGALQVQVDDPVMGNKLAIDADQVVLSAAVLPRSDNKALAQTFQVSLSPDNFYKEAHVKLRPVEFGTDGVFLCGAAHYPKYITETINQSYGAAGRAVALLANDTVIASGSVCTVDEDKCIACGECVRACTYGAVELKEVGSLKKAGVNPVICKGDGLCNCVCPTGAISLKHFTDEEFMGQIDAAMGD